MLWLYHVSLIHSSADRHLNGFHISAIKNTAAMNSHIQVFMWISVFISLGYRPQFSSVQFNRSVMSNSLQPYGLQHAMLPCPSPTPRACSNSCPSSWWCHLTVLFSVIPSPPAFNLSKHQGLFQWVSSSHHVAKYWSFSFSISPFNEFSGLISYRMDWLDLLAVQGTLKSLL